MELRLARAARLIRQAADGERGEVVPQALLDGLNQVVPGTCACFTEMDVRHQRVISFQSSEPPLPGTCPESDWEESWWNRYPQFRRLRGCGRCNGDLTGQQVVKLSDARMLPGDRRHEMFVPLRTTPGQTRDFVCCRRDGDFSEADRDLLTLLRLHLQAAYEAHRRRRAGLPELTERQWQVLRCLAQGQSTDEVAAAMCVSTSTVRKHLENIYDRLDVTSRAAAVGRAFSAGPGSAAAR
jgi:DNA-binding CsgD family transcriptional regulator